MLRPEKEPGEQRSLVKREVCLGQSALSDMAISVWFG